MGTERSERWPALPSERTWSSFSKAIGPVALFRTMVGATLAAQFATHAVRTAPLLAQTGLFDAHFAGDGVRSSVLGDGGSAAVLRLAFGMTAVAALGATVSVVPRWCSVACSGAVLALSVATVWAVLPVAYVDDTSACWMSLFLLCIPPAPLSRRRGREAGARVSGLAVVCLLAAVVVLYASGALGSLSGVDGPSNAGVAMASRLLAVGLVIPSTGVLALAVASQLALHAYLACTTPAVFLNVGLAATAILFWGERRANARTPVPFEAGGVVALTVLVLTALALGPAPVARSSTSTGPRTVLRDLGLLPANPTLSGAGSNVFVVGVADRANAQGEPPVEYSYTVQPARAKLLASHMGAESQSPLRYAIAARFALRDCRSRPGDGRPLSLFVTQADAPVAEFACDADRLAWIRPPSDVAVWPGARSWTDEPRSRLYESPAAFAKTMSP